MADREKYFTQVMKMAEDKEEMGVLRASNILSLEGAEVLTPSVILNEDFVIEIVVNNHFPQAVRCQKICVSVSSTPPQHHPSPSHFSKKKHTRTPSLTNQRTEHIANFQPIRKQLPAVIDASATYEKRQGKIVGAGVTCKNAHELLKRTDSGPGTQAEVDSLLKGDFTQCLLAEDVELKPGENKVQLKMKTEDKGIFRLSQLCFEIKHLDLLKSLSSWDLYFRVVCDQPSVQLRPLNSDHFIAGIKQDATLTLNTGSSTLPGGCSAQFKSEHLEVLTKGGNSVLKLTLLEADQSADFGVTLFHQTSSTFNVKSHSKLTCHVDVWDKKLDTDVTVVHPFCVKHALHTCREKKYLQVTVAGNTKTEFILTQAEISAVNCKDVELQLMNKPGQELHVNTEQTACYLYQIKCNIPDIPRLTLDFSFLYSSHLDLQEGTRKYTYTCNVHDFQTQYLVSYEVQSGEADKVCRTGRNSLLKLQVRRCETGHSDPDQRLVYDVHTDKSTWALVGKSTNVFCLKDDFYETVLEVVPLTAGFIHLPQVHLLKYTPSHDEVKLKELDPESKEKMTRFSEFSQGEVYNGSRSKQIHVYPAHGGLDVEVTAL